MKNIFFKKCEYNGCKKNVYAEGLCYKHFAEKISAESNENSEECSHRYKDAIGAVFHLTAVLLVVLVWLGCAASAVLFAVYCYRSIQSDGWKMIIIAALLIVLAYILLCFVLKMFDRFKVSKYIFIALAVTGIVFIATNGADLYYQYTDCLEKWALAFTKSAKGILFK